VVEELKNPPGANCWNREKLRALGEGQMITVVAWALAARAGGQESCNCYLSEPKDTDNHIVLVDPNLKRPTLKMNEAHSVTAEFTPRVRLHHRNFTQEKLEPLIDPTWKRGQTPKKGKLLVRVTGRLMFDSEHYCGPIPLNVRTNGKFTLFSKWNTARTEKNAGERVIKTGWTWIMFACREQL
jgi:hypothetical protein